MILKELLYLYLPLSPFLFPSLISWHRCIIAFRGRDILLARLLSPTRIRHPDPVRPFGLWFDRYPYILVHDHDQEQEKGREEGCLNEGMKFEPRAH